MRVFAVDLGGTNVKWGLIEGARVLRRGVTPTAFGSADELIGAIADVAEGLGPDAFEGIGVSVPGSVSEEDPSGTVSRGGALPYLDGCPLGQLLAERLGVPAFVGNDGKSCALGEYEYGALRGSRVGVVLAVGTGIGGGIVIEGRVLHGAHCFAGEFSFLSNDVNGPFGLGGVFGSTGGWMGLRDLVLEEKGIADATGVDGHMIFEWIDAGDEAARRGLARYARAFDRWLMNLQAVLDPDVFAIAGGISARPALIRVLRDEMPAEVAHYGRLTPLLPHPNVVAAELGNDANLFGAALGLARRLAAECG